MLDRSSSKIWFLALVCLLSVQAAATALLPPSRLLSSIADWVSLLLLSSAAACFGRNAFVSKGLQRTAWALLSGGYAIEVIGQVLWTYEEVVRGYAPKMSISDALIFAAWTALIAGFALRPHLQASRQHRKIGTLDILLLLGSWLYLYLFLVVPWQYIFRNELAQGLAYQNVALAEDIVLLIIVALAFRQTSGQWRRFYLLLTCIVAFDTLMEYVVDSAILSDQVSTGSWYDLASSLGIAGMTVAALVGYRLEPEAESANPNDERYWQWTSRLAAPVILILPFLALWAFLDRKEPNSVLVYRVLVTLGAMIVLGFVAILKQMRLEKELAHANTELLEASLTDLLTGVRNRRFFTHAIEADVQQVLRAFSPNVSSDARNRDLIFYLIDFDHFKKINDRFGHHTGDQVLVEMTRRISSAMRLSDALIRWGGEEFLTLSRYTDRKEAEILAKRVLDAVGAEPYILEDGSRIQATCSVGWAAFPLFPTHPTAFSHEQVLALADRALYHAKSSGRNQAIGLLPSTAGPPRASGAFDLALDAVSLMKVMTPGPNGSADLNVSYGATPKLIAQSATTS